MSNSTKVITGPNTIFSYLTVLEPKTPIGGGTPKYSVSLIIPKTDTATIQKIKDAIKAAMAEIEQEEISGDGWRATWHNTNATRFDSKAFKAAHADLYAAFTVKTTGTRFTLNAVSA